MHAKQKAVRSVNNKPGSPHKFTKTESSLKGSTLQGRRESYQKTKGGAHTKASASETVRTSWGARNPGEGGEQREGIRREGILEIRKGLARWDSLVAGENLKGGGELRTPLLWRGETSLALAFQRQSNTLDPSRKRETWQALLRKMRDME